MLLDDLRDFCVRLVMIDGQVVARDGEALFAVEPFRYPAWATHTMRIDPGLVIDAATFRIPAVDGRGRALCGPSARVRVMEAISARVNNRELHLSVPVRDGELAADPEHDVLKAFVFERHHETGTFGRGFVTGFGIRGALAQTVAHDAHNLLVIGSSDEDMALAANTLRACGGGAVAVRDGQVLGLVELPVAGLMSTKTVEEVSAEADGLEAAWRKMGCTMPSPFMTMGLLSLACLPELRLTNRGLVDCTTFEFVPLVVEE